MIMRRRCQHGVRQRNRAITHSVMKFGDRNLEAPRIESDVVARYQPAITVKRGILDRFGAQWRSQLLESGKRCGLGSIGRRSDALARKPLPDNVDQPSIAGKTGGL